MRWKLLAIVGFCTVVGIFVVRTSRLRPAAPAEDDPVMARVIEEIRFEGTPLRAAIEELAQRGGTRILVDWPALEAVGVRPECAVDLRLFNLPLRVLLVETLISANPQRQPLSCHAAHGVVHITTRAVDDRNTVLREYHVNDFIDCFPVARDADPMTRQERLDALVRLIEET